MAYNTNMTTENLSSKKCVPCEVGGVPLPHEEMHALLKEIPLWTLSSDTKKIFRLCTYKNFRTALDFVNKVGDVAESEGHHPDIFINYNKVTLELTTHAVGGLTENDFIMAAKIDKINFTPIPRGLPRGG
jgi:4a-hydroxytetrahydrobiopterin dehydratase